MTDCLVTFSTAKNRWRVVEDMNRAERNALTRLAATPNVAVHFSDIPDGRGLLTPYRQGRLEMTLVMLNNKGLIVGARGREWQITAAGLLALESLEKA